MKTFPVVTLLSLFFSIAGWSQTKNCNLKLSITVKDDHTLEALSNCYVFIQALNKTYITNAAGKISINQLCSGKYKLKIIHIGCDTLITEINVQSNTTQELYMHHVKVELGEVVVQDQKKDATSIKTSIRGNDIFKTRGLNLAQSLQQINGVRLLSTGSTIAKPIIHGLHSNRIVVVNNGVKLESQQWGTDHAPEIDPFSADKFTVVKGAAAVKYGAEAMAGVVITEPKPIRVLKGTNAEINTALFSNNRMGVISGLLETSNGKINNLGFRVQGTIKRGGNFKVPQYWIANTGVEEANLSAAVSYHQQQWKFQFFSSYFSTTIGLYPGAHVENLTDLERAIASPSPLFISDFSYAINKPKQQAAHFLNKLQVNYQLNSAHQFTVTVAHQENKRKEFDPRSFITLPEMSLSLGTTSAELLYNAQLLHQLKIESGVQFNFQQNINNATSSRIFIRNYESTNLAAFTNLQYNSNKLTLEAGVRVDNRWFESYYKKNDTLTIHTRNFSNLTSTIGAAYAISNNLKIAANIASAWRPPAPNELYANGLHQGLASIEIGNQDFKAEKSWSTNVQIDYTKDSTLLIEAVLYNNSFENFIFLQPSLPPALTIRGYYPVFQYQQTDANLMGADFTMHYFLKSNFKLTGKASFLRAKNTITNEWIVLMETLIAAHCN
ncbi:MAG: TonB-dependent receptor [Chitinophagaceae bacterium]|nr:TonB-dependent receptor [Chitinophagaceae bacterium]